MQMQLQQIATICSPFCQLQDMPVQPCGAKDIYGTIEFKEKFVPSTGIRSHKNMCITSEVELFIITL